VGRLDRTDSGFTLIELMVVVLIIAVLLAIAVPTFLGARENAQRRAAQSNVRNVFTVQNVHYSDASQYTEDASALIAQDNVFTYVTTLPIPPGPRTVYVDVTTTGSLNDTVYLASRTPAGECFWLRTVGNEGVPRFAKDDCSGASLVFTEQW
jgi:type IV pilus assembly protein PilA